MGRGKTGQLPQGLLYGSRERRVRPQDIERRWRLALSVLRRDQGGPLVELLATGCPPAMAVRVLATVGQSDALGWLGPQEVESENDLARALEVAARDLLTRQDSADITSKQLGDEIDLARERALFGRLDDENLESWGYHQGLGLLDRHGFGVLLAPDLLRGLARRQWGGQRDLQKAREHFVADVSPAAIKQFIANHQDQVLDRLRPLAVDAEERGIDNDEIAEGFLIAIDMSLNELSNLDIAQNLYNSHGNDVWLGLLDKFWADGQPRPKQARREHVRSAIERYTREIEQREPDYVPDLREVAICVAQATWNQRAERDYWTPAEIMRSLLYARLTLERPREKLLSNAEIRRARNDSSVPLDDRERWLVSDPDRWRNDQSAGDIAMSVNRRRAIRGRVLQIDEGFDLPFWGSGTVAICDCALDDGGIAVYWPWGGHRGRLDSSFPYHLVGRGV